MQVMHARWQEGAVLLFYRGLGTKGEVDSVAAERASFAEWCSTQAAKRGSANKDGAHADPKARNCDPQDAAIESPQAQQEPASAAASSTGEADNVAGMPLQELDRTIECALGIRPDGTSQASASSMPSCAVSDGVQPPPPAHPALQVRMPSDFLQGSVWECRSESVCMPCCSLLCARSWLRGVHGMRDAALEGVVNPMESTWAHRCAALCIPALSHLDQQQAPHADLQRERSVVQSSLRLCGAKRGCTGGAGQARTAHRGWRRCRLLGALAASTWHRRAGN